MPPRLHRTILNRYPPRCRAPQPGCRCPFPQCSVFPHCNTTANCYSPGVGKGSGNRPRTQGPANLHVNLSPAAISASPCFLNHYCLRYEYRHTPPIRTNGELAGTLPESETSYSKLVNICKTRWVAVFIACSIVTENT